jgi:hypothetical protein
MNIKRLLGVLGVVALIVGALYLSKNYRTGEMRAVETPAPQENTMTLFHPDSVLAFQWKTKSKSHEFVRSSREKPWSPDVDPQTIQTRLNLIAVANYSALEATEQPLVNVTVAFGEKNQWTGAFDGKYFFWTSGTHNKLGFQVKAQDLQKFEAGSLAFQDKKLSWCPQRIKTLEVDSGAIKYKLRQQGLKWIVDQKEVDPTFVEQWFGKACSNLIEEFIDPSIAGEKYKFEGSFTANFSNGKSLSWKQDLTAPAFNDGTRQFLSPALATHLAELQAAPVLGDAPAPVPEEAIESVKPATPVKKPKKRKTN